MSDKMKDTGVIFLISLVIFVFTTLALIANTDRTTEQSIGFYWGASALGIIFSACKYIWHKWLERWW